MSSGSNTRILCERPLDSNFADHLEAALSDPAIGVLLIEFQTRPETEKLEIEQILAADPLNFEALCVYGYIEVQLQDYQVAAEYFQRALAVQDSPAIRLTLSQLPR